MPHLQWINLANNLTQYKLSISLLLIDLDIYCLIINNVLYHCHGKHMWSSRNFQVLESSQRRTITFGTKNIFWNGLQIWNLMPESLKTLPEAIKLEIEIKKKWKKNSCLFNILALSAKNCNFFIRHIYRKLNVFYLINIILSPRIHVRSLMFSYICDTSYFEVLSRFCKGSLKL